MKILELNIPEYTGPQIVPRSSRPSFTFPPSNIPGKKQRKRKLPVDNEEQSRNGAIKVTKDNPKVEVNGELNHDGKVWCKNQDPVEEAFPEVKPNYDNLHKESIEKIGVLGSWQGPDLQVKVSTEFMPKIEETDNNLNGSIDSCLPEFESTNSGKETYISTCGNKVYVTEATKVEVQNQSNTSAFIDLLNSNTFATKAVPTAGLVGNSSAPLKKCHYTEPNTTKSSKDTCSDSVVSTPITEQNAISLCLESESVRYTTVNNSSSEIFLPKMASYTDTVISASRSLAGDSSDSMLHTGNRDQYGSSVQDNKNS